MFRHANLAGTSPHGGVLALMGDDHTAESSTTAHQSEFAFVDVMMPILSPAGVQEMLDYGALGWALSRYAGVWVGLKCIKDTIEFDGGRRRLARPRRADRAGRLSNAAGRPEHPHARRHSRRRRRGCRSTSAPRWSPGSPPTSSTASITTGGAAPKIGVITLGKSYLDMRQALDDLGIDEARCNALGLRLYKLGCAWPIEPEGLREFARGLALIIVVEEKRSLIEVQVREELYGCARLSRCASARRDEAGRLAVSGQGRARPQRHRASRSANGC